MADEGAWGVSDERSDSRWANLPRLQRVGLTSWLLLGIIGLIVVILLALGAVSLNLSSGGVGSL